MTRQVRAPWRRRRIERYEEAHLSVSSSEAKPWALCFTRMRVNAQEEKRKHGITCHTSSPLETGVPQRDFRVWLHPKRRLACPLRRLPMKPNGPRRRRRIDVPRRSTLLRSDQYANCAKRYSISSTEAKSRDLCRARMRRNEQAENESTILHMIRVAPWRRGAPKAQDGCASKRHPSTQRKVCQLCKVPLRIVNGSEVERSLLRSYAT